MALLNDGGPDPLFERFPSVRSTIFRMDAIAQQVCAEIPGRADAISAVVASILAKRNVFLVGPPGVAKTMLSRAIFSRITGAKLFVQQCDKMMSTEALFGPIDVPALKGGDGKSSVYRHNTENTLVDAQFAHLDELMDAPSSVRRACLGILNERTFQKGSHNHAVPLWTAVATSNFFSTESVDEAVMDRFGAQVFVGPVGKESLLQAISTRSFYDPDESTTAPMTISMDDLIELNWAMNYVTLGASGAEAIDALLLSITSLDATMTAGSRIKPVRISDRRVIETMVYAKVAALRDHRSYVTASDVLCAVRFLVPCGEAPHWFYNTSHYRAAHTAMYDAVAKVVTSKMALPQKG